MKMKSMLGLYAFALGAMAYDPLTKSKLSFIGGIILIDFNRPFKKQLKQIAIGSLLYVTSKGLTHQSFKY